VPSKTRNGTPIQVGNRPDIWAGPENVWQATAGRGPMSATRLSGSSTFTHEGGISTPFIVRWPDAIQTNGGFTRQIGHITDL